VVGEPDQVQLGAFTDVGGDGVGGQVLEGVRDDVGLVEVDPAGQDRRAQVGVVLVEGAGEPVEALAGLVVVAGGRGVPVAGGAGADLLGDVAGGGHHRQQQPLGAGDDGGQLAHRGGLVGGGHEGGVEGGGLVEFLGDARDDVQQRVLWVCVVSGFHGVILRGNAIDRNRCSSYPQTNSENSISTGITATSGP